MRDVDPFQSQNSTVYDYLFSILIHDLRSSLSSLDMGMQLLKNNIDEKLIGSDLYSILDATTTSSKLLTNLLGDLLMLEKARSAYSELTDQLINLNLLLSDVLALYSTPIKQKKLEIVLEISTEYEELYIKKEVVETCMRNLVSNAIKYSYVGGLIKISIKEDHSMLIFSIQDQGCGISTHTQDEIRGENKICSTKGTYEEIGSGWGLFIIKNILKINKGDLWFESQPSKGTIFNFSIPKTINNK